MVLPEGGDTLVEGKCRRQMIKLVQRVTTLGRGYICLRWEESQNGDLKVSRQERDEYLFEENNARQVLRLLRQANTIC